MDPLGLISMVDIFPTHQGNHPWWKCFDATLSSVVKCKQPHWNANGKGSFHWWVQAEEVYESCLLDNSDWFACVVPHWFQVILPLKRSFPFPMSVEWENSPICHFPSFPIIALLLTPFFCFYVISNTSAVTATYGLASVSQRVIKCDILPPTTGCSDSSFPFVFLRHDTHVH